MKANLAKIFAWFLIGAGFLLNLLLLREAVELPTLSGAGAAQADLGLYLVVNAIGVPIAVLSLVILVTGFLVRSRTKGFVGMLQYNYGIGIVAFINVLIPLSIWYWLVYLWK